MRHVLVGLGVSLLSFACSFETDQIVESAACGWMLTEEQALPALSEDEIASGATCWQFTLAKGSATTHADVSACDVERRDVVTFWPGTRVRHWTRFGRKAGGATLLDPAVCVR